jgi:hypothetical protein
MKKQIQNIHLYGEAWTPEYFKQFGVRGWWIRFLNRLRWSLELRVNWHVMVVLGQATDRDLSQMQVGLQEQYVPTYEIKDNFGKPYAPPTSESTPRARTTAEETNRVLARFLAPSRSKRYASSRHRRPVYEAELLEMPDGGNEKELSPDATGTEEADQGRSTG